MTTRKRKVRYKILSSVRSKITLEHWSNEYMLAKILIRSWEERAEKFFCSSLKKAGMVVHYYAWSKLNLRFESNNITLIYIPALYVLSLRYLNTFASSKPKLYFIKIKPRLARVSSQGYINKTVLEKNCVKIF